MNITITMHCSTVTVAVANHRPCHANKDNLDRWREGDKVQQRMQGRGLARPSEKNLIGNHMEPKHIRRRCKLTKTSSHINHLWTLSLSSEAIYSNSSPSASEGTFIRTRCKLSDFRNGDTVLRKHVGASFAWGRNILTSTSRKCIFHVRCRCGPNLDFPALSLSFPFLSPPALSSTLQSTSSRATA